MGFRCLPEYKRRHFDLDSFALLLQAEQLAAIVFRHVVLTLAEMRIDHLAFLVDEVVSGPVMVMEIQPRGKSVFRRHRVMDAVLRNGSLDVVELFFKLELR